MMNSAPDDITILQRMTLEAPLTLDDLQQHFQDFSWNRLFAAIDRMSREGTIALRRLDRRTYLITLRSSVSLTATGTPPRYPSSACL